MKVEQFSAQTWNLLKNLHRRIFRLKILHRQFYLLNFNSFSKKKAQKMSENGEIYTAGKNFTLPPAVRAWTNLTSGCNLQPRYIFAVLLQQRTEKHLSCNRTDFETHLGSLRSGQDKMQSCPAMQIIHIFQLAD